MNNETKADSQERMITLTLSQADIWTRNFMEASSPEERKYCLEQLIELLYSNLKRKLFNE